MNTEITITKDFDVAKGWVFYDGECPVCAGGVARCGRFFARRGFVWQPLQTPGAAARLGMSEEVMREEMKLLRADGRVCGGADALAALLRSVWWLWPLGALMAVPGLRHLARLGYRWVTRNRYCFGETCQLTAPPTRHHRTIVFFELP